MMGKKTFVIAVVLGLCLGGCAKTLRVDSVGYEVRAPSGVFFPPASHEEAHLEKSPIGPVDLAETRFGGGRELYYVLGLRSPVFRKTEEVLRAAHAGLVPELEKGIGIVGAKQRIDRPDALGEELVVIGTKGEHKGRVVRLRFYVAAGGLFALAAGADQKDAQTTWLTQRWNEFFDGFKVTPSASTAPAEGGPNDPSAIASVLVSRWRL